MCAYTISCKPLQSTGAIFRQNPFLQARSQACVILPYRRKSCISLHNDSQLKNMHVINDLHATDFYTIYVRNEPCQFFLPILAGLPTASSRTKSSCQNEFMH